MQGLLLQPLVAFLLFIDRIHGEESMLRYTAKDKSEADAILKEMKDQNIDVWRENIAPKEAIDVILPPIGPKREKVIAYFAKYKVQIFKHRDLDNLILDMDAQNKKAFSLYQYNSWEQIETHLKALPVKHADQVTLTKIGSTVESRPLYVVIVGKKPLSKQVVIINCNSEASHWITSAACLVLIDALLGVPRNQAALEKFTFHVIPLLNPDGYVKSWTKRLWRKNTSPNPAHKTCPGVNLSRNMDTYFGVGDNTVSYPCFQTFSGKRPFTELETIAIRDYYAKITVFAFFDIQAFGQYWLLPPGHTTEHRSTHYVLLKHLVNKGMAGIRSTSNQPYTQRSAASMSSPFGGRLVDYFHVKGAKLAVGIRLRPNKPGDEYNAKFNLIWYFLPEKYIKLSGEELLPGLLMALYHFQYSEDGIVGELGPITGPPAATTRRVLPGGGNKTPNLTREKPTGWLWLWIGLGSSVIFLILLALYITYDGFQDCVQAADDPENPFYERKRVEDRDREEMEKEDEEAAADAEGVEDEAKEDKSVGTEEGGKVQMIVGKKIEANWGKKEETGVEIKGKKKEEKRVETKGEKKAEKGVETKGIKTPEKRGETKAP